MIIDQKLIKFKKNSENCKVWEYPNISENLSFAKSEINGRYPNKNKKSTNTEVEQLYFVISGEGNIFTKDKTFKIKKGDLCFFEKGEEYQVLGNNLNILIINSPKRNLKQYKIL